VYEIFEFSLLDGADVSAFIAADQRVQMEFFYQQPGLVRRTTSRGREGRWAVITLWGSEEEAEGCAKNSSGDDAYAHFMSFIDPSSVEVKQYFGLEG
jgi:hypothetical protein